MGLRNDYYFSTYQDQIREAFIGKDNRMNFRYLMHSIHLYHMGKYKRCIKVLNYLKEKAKTNDDFCAVLFFKGRCYSDLGYRTLAIETFESILIYNDKYGSALSNLGRLYAENGENNKAIDCYTKAIAQDSSNATTFNNLGHLYLTMAEYESAIEYARVALGIQGNLYQAANCICMSYYALGDRRNGEKYFKIAVSNGQDPDTLKMAIQRMEAIVKIDEFV